MRSRWEWVWDTSPWFVCFLAMGLWIALWCFVFAVCAGASKSGSYEPTGTVLVAWLGLPSLAAIAAVCRGLVALGGLLRRSGPPIRRKAGSR